MGHSWVRVESSHPPGFAGFGAARRASLDGAGLFADSLAARSTTHYHRDRQGVLRHQPRARGSLEPENRSSRLRGMGDSSGDETGDSVII